MKCKDCLRYFRNPHNLCYFAESEQVDAETEACEDFVPTYNKQSDYSDDPCYGCQAYDGGYNCKHCEYGDDGHYSIYDVYRPSELI